MFAPSRRFSPQARTKVFVYKAVFFADTQNPTSLQPRRYHVEQNAESVQVQDEQFTPH